MKRLIFLLIGIFFGIIMTKSEAISWYRIQEMFRFDSFHMYGIIMSAVITGMVLTFTMKKNKAKDIYGQLIQFKDKQMSIARYGIGGIIFGLGWALSGACPGPIYTLIGNGYTTLLIVLLGALLGTYTYGAVRDKLPH